ncbi:MAG: hypothetical protein AB1512_17165 [Thermodesulfobacteriota bacterium]
MSPNRILLALRSCLAVALLCFSSQALGDEQELLKELDGYLESSQEDTTPEKAGGASRMPSLGAQIADHFDGQLRLRGYAFIKDAPKGLTDTAEGNPVAEAQLRASSWAGGDGWSIHASGWLEAGTEENTYQGIDPVGRDKDRQRRYLELNELYYTHSREDTDLTIGQKVFRNGISTLYSPADRYRFLDLNDPTDFKDFGAWQVKVDHQREDMSLTAAVLPLYQPMKLPDVSSRWMQGVLDTSRTSLPQARRFPFNFIDFPHSREELLELLYYFWDWFFGDSALSNRLKGKTVLLQEDLPDNQPEDYGWFGRAKGSVGLWDLFASVYHGPGFYPVMRVEEFGDVVVITREIPNVLNLATGFSTTWRGFEFHGEALYNRTEQDRDDDYIAYVIGITRSEQVLARKLGIDRIDLTIEYAGETITKGVNMSEGAFSSRAARLGRDDLLIRAGVTLNEDIGIDYLADIVFWNRSRFQRLGGWYRISSGLVCRLDLESFSGHELSYYGRWRNNDRIISTLTWGF